MHPGPWIVRRPANGRRLRLFCFAYAGGSPAIFLPWQARLDPAIEVCAVQLPGRGARMAEAPPGAMAPLAQSLAFEIARYPDLPYAFFGHSLGALLAFEVARHGAMRRFPPPQHLLLSGCDAPQCRLPSKNLHLLGDDELIAALRDYNGTPAAVLADRELMDLLLPAIRADFALAADYRYRPGLRLAVPITVLAGTRDNHCQLDKAGEWARETAAACRVEWFEGDHFFIHEGLDAVLACIAAALAPAKG